MKTTEQMTDQELVAAAKNHDAIHNEGFEGYNPFWNVLKDREAKREADRPKSREEQIYALQRRLERECGSIVRENSLDPDAIDVKEEDLRSQISGLKTEIKDEFLVDWPRDRTIQRQSDWNGLVKAGKVYDTATANRQQKTQGWRLIDLKRALEYHNIPRGK